MHFQYLRYYYYTLFHTSVLIILIIEMRPVYLMIPFKEYQLVFTSVTVFNYFIMWLSNRLCFIINCCRELPFQFVNGLLKDNHIFWRGPYEILVMCRSSRLLSTRLTIFFWPLHISNIIGIYNPYSLISKMQSQLEDLVGLRLRFIDVQHEE